MKNLCHCCLLLLFLLKSLSLHADQSNLMRDLEIVNYWNATISERFPVTYNHLLQGGYWNMPSARMGNEGEVAVGYSSVPPYRNFNLRVQLIDRLEISGNYRIFRGVDDPILTPMGFGDLSDKGANVKICIIHPEDSDYNVPGISIGFEDFMGTQNFRAQYIVATQVLLKQNLELSLGYGRHRIRGFFGGVTWIPFRTTCYPYLQGLALCAEYDATPYKRKSVEKHPGGRVKKSPINVGLKYRLWDQFDFSVSYVRGCAWAWSLSTYYDFGNTEGFLPKIHDPLPYKAPIITEPLGPRRPERMMAQDLLYALQRQGLQLLEATLDWDECGDQLLRLKIENDTYRVERDVKNRLNDILAALIPDDIDIVIVVIETDALPIQEYRFIMEYVRAYGDREIGIHELNVLSPMREVTFDHTCLSRRIFKQSLEWWNFELFPRTNTFFGSSKGKFKYALGLNVGINGFLFDSLYYSLRLGWAFISNLGEVSGVDRLNPSQLINVRTDIIKYYNQSGVCVDEAYLQKNWNLGKGFYSKAAVGHFEQEYGGVATEFLYYPVGQQWAVGIEGACLGKRKFSGIGFTDKVRKLHGFVPSYRKFVGSQFFLDLYYEWRQAKLDFKIMIGKFLANDYGVRYEVIRYFPSGMRIHCWYTMTNGRDRINDHTYYDKGVAISMPIDIFYTRTDRSRWGYGMSAWLRDVGVTAYTGMRLYDLIREQRVD